MWLLLLFILTIAVAIIRYIESIDPAQEYNAKVKEFNKQLKKRHDKLIAKDITYE